MEYEQVADPAEFRHRTTRLLADEARHNLIRGILGNIIERPDTYPEYRLFIVDSAGHSVSAGLMTAPYNLILADTADDEALQALATGISADGVDLPGAIGNQPTVDRFVARWRQLANVVAHKDMAQGVFAISRVIGVPFAPGSARPADPDDADLVVDWLREFVAEALPNEPHDEEQLSRAVEGALSGHGPRGYWLWENDDRRVSMSGHGSPTGSGIRIGGVYTPPEERRNGYAAALVATQSRWLLDNGYDFCFLFTDLANPTSNAIYERIGYRQVAEAASYRFEAR